MKRHFRTCNLCEAMCGLAMTVADGRVTDVRGDDEDVFSRGHICPKGPALRELHEDPDRLRQPLRRTRSGWEPVSWQQALDETAARLSSLRARHGKSALGLYVGNPVVHNHGAAIALQGFARALGTRNRFDANSQDANPRLLASLLLYGDQLSIPVPDVDRTDLLIMLGANPAASNGSIMTLGDVRGRMKGIRERGGRLVLIDPRRTETAAWATEHHFIRPGGDAALLLAMLCTLFEERLIDEAATRAAGRGLDALRAAALRFPPERVAGPIGVPADVIRGLARDLARTPRAVAYGRVGVCQNPHATVASCLLDVLNVVTGHFDRPGGLLFPSPAVDLQALGRRLAGSSYARFRSRVRGLPEVGGQLPAAVIAEEIETPGEGQIRGFVVLSGNPVLSTPNGERLARAMSSLEFMVSIDIYLNETSRLAHLVLPPVSPLERSHYDVVFHGFAVRNTAKYSPPLFTPPPGAKTDWDILWELGMRLGGMRFAGRAVDGALRAAWRAGLRPTADQVIDLALRTGPYGGGPRGLYGLLPGGKGLTLDRLRRAPHGVDLGPLVPSARARVKTADGLVDLAPEVVLADLARVDAWLDEARSASLVLIGRRHVRTNNSWMHNCASLVKGPDRSALLMHPDDRARLGLADGEHVRVTSRAGTALATLRSSDEVMPGVVSLPHGYGHAAAADSLRVAGAVPGPNINALTDELLLDPLSGTAALNGVPVRIEAVGTPAKAC